MRVRIPVVCHSASGARADEFLNPARTRVPVVSVFLEESAALRALSGELVHRLRCFMVSLPPPIRGPVHIAVFGIVGAKNLIHIWESGEWQTRTAESRQWGANPLPGKQMVAGLKRKRLGVLPSLH
jgi:hypothetical protein